MRSFDAWDTLIARRSRSDIHDETDNVFPVAENVAKVATDDFIVSDYYDEALLKKIIPTVTGLTNPVVVTEDGKYTGKIWPTLPRITEHLDDNCVCLETATRAGIKATHTRLSEFSKNEKTLLLHFPGLALTMREARLRTWNPYELFRQLQLAQIEANFPMLYLASLLLHKRLTNETVLMSSRDCFLWRNLLQHFKDRTEANYTIEYFLTSRLCREFPSPAYLQYLAGLLHQAVVVDLTGTGRSLSLLLERAGKPDMSIYLLVQYSTEWMKQAYGAARLGNITALTFNGGANLERINLAPHAMVSDVRWTPHSIDPVYFNPCNIDWEMAEIRIQHEAFDTALDAAKWYPLDLHATEEQIHAALQQTFRWIKEYNPALEFASKFLLDEDNAVMARLKCAK